MLHSARNQIEELARANWTDHIAEDTEVGNRDDALHGGIGGDHHAGKVAVATLQLADTSPARHIRKLAGDDRSGVGVGGNKRPGFRARSRRTRPESGFFE